jgi:TfoX/Sxy family transcriptional regulator of competence genes
MGFDEKLVTRTRELIGKSHQITEEKKMFGGLCFMVDHKMCIGVERDRIMVRLDPARYEEALEKPGCNPMDFTGKPMRGYVFVDKDVLSSQKELNYWVQLALEYNAVAKASKKRK